MAEVSVNLHLIPQVGKYPFRLISESRLLGNKMRLDTQISEHVLGEGTLKSAPEKGEDEGPT